MTKIIDAEQIDSMDELTPDETIGFLSLSDEELDGEVHVSISRIRRALLAFEEWCHEDSAHISVVRPDGGAPMLVLQEDRWTERGIVIAGRVGPDDEYMEPEESEDAADA